MDSNYKAYDHEKSFARIDEILELPRGNFTEVGELPSRDRLTYGNGFYAYCSAMFVDIRDSSSLPNKYKRPVLAKIYRAYISEVVAILNSSTRAREVNIVGDGVWAVFNTPKKLHIDEVFSLSAQINSLMKVLNHKMTNKGYEHDVRAGIGLDYGRALMIKAGYSGSGIADVVYMGDVVNRAAKLASKGNLMVGSPPVMLGDVFANNLNEQNSKLISYDSHNMCYSANVINLAMERWHEENCA